MKKALQKTPTIVKRTFCAAIAGIFSFSLLYIFGSLGQIQAYYDPSNISTQKLFGLHIFFFLTLTLSLYRIVQELFKFNLKQNIVMIGIIAISFLLSYKIISIPDSQGHVVGFSYILVGDYLRDVHGINIYFMDWAGWAVTIVLYITGIFTSLLFEVFKKIKPLFKTQN